MPAAGLPPPPFHATVADGTAVVTLAGDLDRTTAAELSIHLQQLLAQAPVRLVYDLAQVSYLDYATARSLLLAATRLPGHPPPTLRRPAPLVTRLLKLTGLDQHCHIEP